MSGPDRRAFMLPPFVSCPYRHELTFGVVAIDGDRDRRRCRSCLGPNGSDRRVSCLVPSITKKILYLDQFAFTDATYLSRPELALTRRPGCSPHDPPGSTRCDASASWSAPSSLYARCRAST